MGPRASCGSCPTSRCRRAATERAFHAPPTARVLARRAEKYARPPPMDDCFRLVHRRERARRPRPRPRVDGDASYTRLLTATALAHPASLDSRTPLFLSILMSSALCKRAQAPPTPIVAAYLNRAAGGGAAERPRMHLHAAVACPADSSDLFILGCSSMPRAFLLPSCQPLCAALATLRRPREPHAHTAFSSRHVGRSCQMHPAPSINVA